jgi:hypothetical protein
MNRQKTLLFILVLIFAAAVIYAYLHLPDQRTVKLGTNPTGTSAAGVRPGSATAKPASTRVDLTLLDTVLPKFSGFKRNIFTLAPPVTRRKLPLPPPPPPPSPPPPPPSPSQTAQNEMVNEMAKFTFLGFLLKDDRKTVFLQKNNEIFVVKTGDRIDNKYVVANIGNDALTIDSTSGGGQIVIPLIENQPLHSSKRR